MNYEELVKALRCKRDDCDGCDLAFFDKDEGWMCQYAAKDDDAAAAIEELQAELEKKRTADCWGCKCDKLEPSGRLQKRGKPVLLAALSMNGCEELPKQGEWELIDGAEPMRWGCSRCKYLSWETSNYCPNCGAKMEVQDGNK